MASKPRRSIMPALPTSHGFGRTKQPDRCNSRNLARFSAVVFIVPQLPIHKVSHPKTKRDEPAGDNPTNLTTLSLAFAHLLLEDSVKSFPSAYVCQARRLSLLFAHNGHEPFGVPSPKREIPAFETLLFHSQHIGKRWLRQTRAPHQVKGATRDADNAARMPAAVSARQ